MLMGLHLCSSCCGYTTSATRHGPSPRIENLDNSKQKRNSNDHHSDDQQNQLNDTNIQSNINNSRYTNRDDYNDISKQVIEYRREVGQNLRTIDEEEPFRMHTSEHFSGSKINHTKDMFQLIDRNRSLELDDTIVESTETYSFQNNEESRKKKLNWLRNSKVRSNLKLKTSSIHPSVEHKSEEAIIVNSIGDKDGSLRQQSRSHLNQKTASNTKQPPLRKHKKLQNNERFNKSPLKSLLALSPIKTRTIHVIEVLIFGLTNSGKTSVIKYLQGGPKRAGIVDELEASRELAFIGSSFMGVSRIKMKKLIQQKYQVQLYKVNGNNNNNSIISNCFDCLAKIHGLLFVIDSSETHRFDEARKCLQNLLSDYRAQNKPLLVFMNKQDLTDSEDEFEIRYRLRLDQLINKYRCPTRIEAGSAVKLMAQDSQQYQQQLHKIATSNEKSSPPIVNSRGDTQIATSSCSLMDTSIESGYNWLIKYIIKNYHKLEQRVHNDTLEQLKRDNISNSNIDKHHL